MRGVSQSSCGGSLGISGSAKEFRIRQTTRTRETTRIRETEDARDHPDP